jgi:hypothetical protein
MTPDDPLRCGATSSARRGRGGDRAPSSNSLSTAIQWAGRCAAASLGLRSGSELARDRHQDVTHP